MGTFATEHLRSGGCRISLNRQEQLEVTILKGESNITLDQPFKTPILSSLSYVHQHNKRPKPPPIAQLPSRNNPHRIPIFYLYFANFQQISVA
jgi:hypothetical protein